MVISHGGQVKPCCWTGHSVGSIYDGADRVWNGATMRSLRSAISRGRIHRICSGAPCPYVRGAKAPGFGRGLVPKRRPPRSALLFDDVWYLAAHADVAQAVRAGRLKSAYQHYRRFGRAEGRAARFHEYTFDPAFVDQFDEAWYEAQYPDVRQAVASGEISSALEHYHEHGRFELRQFRLRAQDAPAHNYRTSLREFLRGALRLAARPTILTFDVTTVCNIRCVMCPHGRQQIDSPEHLDAGVYDLVAHHLTRGVRVQMSGIGEPLLSPLFWRVISGTKETPEVHVRVNSNGLLWTRKNIDAVLDSNLKEISFSVDAARPETYAKIRGARFDKVLRNIRALLAARAARGQATPVVLLNMTLMRENIEEAVGFVELAHALGVDKARMWHLDGFGDEADWIVERKGWVFDYRAQMLHQHPELSNHHIVAAKRRANELGVNLTFINDREILF